MEVILEDNMKKIQVNASDLTPILANRLLECVNNSISRYCDVENMKFDLQDLGVIYEDNAVVCVDNIWYSYDYVGIRNNHIKARIGCENIELYGVNGVIVKDGVNEYELFNDYIGSSNIACLRSDEKINFVEPNLEFEISNLIINVQGTIGNEPFLGTYSYTGTLV